MSQKGVSLFLTMIILSIILAIVLGLSTILVGQMKTIRVMGHSVVAIYAADSGVEQMLKAVFDHMYGGNILKPAYSGFLDLDDDGGGWENGQECPEDLQDSDDACYKAEVVCCSFLDSDCYYNNPENICPELIIEDPNCTAPHFCVRSVGTYKNTKRAIEIEL